MTNSNEDLSLLVKLELNSGETVEIRISSDPLKKDYYANLIMEQAGEPTAETVAGTTLRMLQEAWQVSSTYHRHGGNESLIKPTGFAFWGKVPREKWLPQTVRTIPD